MGVCFCSFENVGGGGAWSWDELGGVGWTRYSL